MRSFMLINLIASVAQAYAKDSMGSMQGSMDQSVNKLIGKLLDRTLLVSPSDQPDVDKTTLGKPSRVAVPLQSGPRFAASHLPALLPLAGRPRPFPSVMAREEHIKQKSSVQWLTTVSAATSTAAAEPEMGSAIAAAGADLEASYARPPVIPKYGQVEEIHSEEDFDNILLQSSGLVVLEVVGGMCRACRRFADTYRRMAVDYYGKASFLKVIYNENESTNKLTMTRLKAKKTPSFFVFLDRKLVAVTGAPFEDELRSALDECILLHGTPKEQPSQVPSIA